MFGVMEVSMKQILLRLSYLLIFLIIATNLFAGTTGKISGKVTDAETGEALPGINIIIDGTTMGAASDIDGHFMINNIPPGSYDIIASGVGFQKKKFVNVKIAVDFTTNLDFTMSTDIIQVETVVVQAEAPIVRKDLTSSHTTYDASQIESLPVESVSQILSLQAGITQGTGGELHIRGGRSTEIAYTVNGVSTSNPYSNGNVVSIATNAIQELSVVSGTFNAEYGNALSGIVNTVTKEGGSKYNGSISFYTGDYLSNHTDIWQNIDDFDPVNNIVTEMTLGGPVPFLSDKVSIFVSGRYSKDKGYLYGVKEHVPSDSGWINDFDANDIRISQNGDGSIVPMNPSEGINATGKLTYRPISTLKINYDVIYSGGESQGYNHNYKYNPDGDLNYYSWGLLNSLELRQAISNTTFYTLRGSYSIDDYKQYLYPLVDKDGNEVDFYAGMYLDPTKYFADPRYQPTHKQSTVASYTFLHGGTSMSHFYQRTYTTGAKFDITSQVSRQHEVKFGLEYRSHKLSYESFTILRDTSNFKTPTIPAEATANRDSYTKKPVEFSTYVQDKMEFDNLIINLGLRYDYFYARSLYSTNTFYPSPNHPELPYGIDPSTLLADSKAKHQISPRLGVSFPITDKGIIHFSYGHFFQIPPFRYLYANPNFEFSYNNQQYGNANLNAEKTVTYELGLQQALTEDLALNVTGYYKDVRDLLTSQQIRISDDETYFKYINKDYANIKGVILAITKRRTAQDNLGFTLDYTFQVADGNDTDADAFFLDISSNRQTEKVPVPLGWDKRHTLNGTVSFGDPKNWNVTFVGRIGTGLPYDPILFDKQVLLKPNSGRRPLQTTINLLAEKTIDLNNFRVVIFAKIFNLFDTKNENLVFGSTGRAGYTLDKTLGTAERTNELAKTVDGLHSADEYFVRPDFYLPPREVRLGVSVEF